MNKIKALKEERGRLLGELSALQTTIEKEARSMAESENNRLTEIEARLGAIKAEVETLGKIAKPCSASRRTQRKPQRRKGKRSNERKLFFQTRNGNGHHRSPRWC
jgi:hypothetical protein